LSLFLISYWPVSFVIYAFSKPKLKAIELIIEGAVTIRKGFITIFQGFLLLFKGFLWLTILLIAMLITSPFRLLLEFPKAKE
jgi:hypothetical protein